MPRRNECRDPSGAVDVNLWTTSGFWVTTRRVTGLSGFPRSTGCSLSPGFFSSGATMVSARADADPNTTISAVAWLRSDSTRSYTIGVQRYSNGNAQSLLASTTRTLSAGVPTEVRLVGVNLGSGSVDEVGVYVAPRDNNFVTFVMSSVRIEQVNEALEYADGATPRWAWDGTPGRSTSGESEVRIATEPGVVTVAGPNASVAIVSRAVRVEAPSGPVVVAGPDPAMYAVIYALPGHLEVAGVAPLIPIEVVPDAGEIPVAGLPVVSARTDYRSAADVFGYAYHERYVTARGDDHDPYAHTVGHHDRYHVVPLRPR